VFSTLHELLVDDLAGIIGTGLDMHGFLHDGIRSATQRLSRAILGIRLISRMPAYNQRPLT
jgi:hypothetical protein